MDQNLYDEFGNYIGPGFEDDYDNGFNSDISDTESNYNSNNNNKIQDSKDNLKVDSVVDSLKDSINTINTLKDSVDSINSKENVEEEVYKGVEVYIREEDIQTIEIPIIKSNEINKRKKYKLDSDITLKNFHILEENLPENKFNFQFLSSITKKPQFIRNICIAGNFHDGKTTFIDRLIEFTRQHIHTHSFHTNSHYNTNNSNSPYNTTNSHKSTSNRNKYSDMVEYNRYMDNRMDEQLRELSIKSTPISIILENRLYEKINEESTYPKYKSYLFNIFDTPGHVNFMDEFVYSLAICDGCVLIVDVLIGLTKVTEQIIIQCLQTGVHMCLILNCIDRLILELKLPPADAYLKIQHTIIEINQFIYSSSTVLGHTATNGHDTSTKVSNSNTNGTPFGGTLGPSTVTELFDPKNNNVGFGSSKFGIFFTLKSFATLYTNDNVTQFSKLLYGNYYYDPIHNIITTNNTTTTGTRTKGMGVNGMDGVNGKGVNGMSDGLDGTSDRVNGMEEGNNEIELERTFVVFILEPLYKLISHIASDEKEDLDIILSDLSNSLFNTKLTHTKNYNTQTEDYTEDYMEDEEDEEDEENSSIENSFKNNKKKIILRKLDYKLTTNKIIRKVFNQIFTDASAFVDLILTTIPSSLENNLNKFICHYTGTLYKNLLNSVGNCDPSGPLIIFITKNYYFDDGFSLFGRIFSGTIFKGQKVKLLGPSYTLDDDEDVIIRNISNIWIYEGRYRIEVTNMTAGNWVMLSGIDLSHYKITTIVNSSSTVLGPTTTNGPNTNTNGVSSNTMSTGTDGTTGTNTGAVGASTVTEEELELMRIITNIKCIRPIFKIGLEPLNPNELPKMINGLRSIEKSYPGSLVKVEESGEHIILGTGELYLDCILHDLRLFGNLEIKVSDPVVKFSETITESTSLITFTHTNNLKNKLYMISQPLESNISTLLDSTIGVNSIGLDCGLGGMELDSRLDGGLDSMGLNGVGRGVYRGVGMSSMGMSGLDMELNKEWDILDIKNVWSFGNGIPDVLINDTIPNEVDINLLNHIKSSIIQGFQWAIKEGPLIEEHIRNVKFRLINCELSNEYINITPGQIIPATRRLCYSSFLLSTPRLMEPILFSEIFCPADCVSEAYKILSKRRGHVLKDMPKPGTPFYIVHAYLPAIESFGFETDLRVDTSGQAFCLSMFDHWNIVPGDPLDKSIILRTLEPAPIPHLAREFLVKTRRRKGLTEDVSINTFFDEEMITSLAENLQEFY